MRIIAQDAETATFRVHARERDLLVFLLRRYPVHTPTDRQLAAPEDREAFAEQQAFLAECLSEEQSANQSRIQSFILRHLSKSPTPPEPASPGTASPSNPLPNPTVPPPEPFLTFQIDRDTISWLLQVVNDVRVGCWVRLGRPEALPRLREARNPAQAMDLAALELGELVQYQLLEALNAP